MGILTICFEDINGVLKKFVKGPREPIVQITNRCIMSHTKNNADINFMSPSVKAFWNKLGRMPQNRKEKKVVNFHLHKSFANKYSENRIFEKQNSYTHNNYIFKPKSKNEYPHEKKEHNNCYFSILEGSELLYGEIHCILNDTLGTYFFYKAIQPEEITKHYCKAQILEEFYLVRLNASLTKQIKMRVDGNDYLSKVQYKLHID